MAKTSGLGERAFICLASGGPALDISGDVGSIDTAQRMMATDDDTGIDKSAHERLALEQDGKFGWTGFWNPSSTGLVPEAEAIYGNEAMAIWLLGVVEGSGAFAIDGLCTSWNANRANSGALRLKVGLDSFAGLGAIWGILGANATDASAANHTTIDGGQQGPSKTITGISIASPGVVTCTAHGLTTGDTVSISGTNSTPVIDGDRSVTVINANTFTVAVNTTGSGSAGTFFRTSTRHGAYLMALLLSIGSGAMAPKAQDSLDGVTFNDLSGMTGSTMNGGAAAQAVVGSTTALVRRYVRLASSGTFTNADWVGAVARFGGNH